MKAWYKFFGVSKLENFTAVKPNYGLPQQKEYELQKFYGEMALFTYEWKIFLLNIHVT